jgi:hypothetical protein
MNLTILDSTIPSSPVRFKVREKIPNQFQIYTTPVLALYKRWLGAVPVVDHKVKFVQENES